MTTEPTPANERVDATAPEPEATDPMQQTIGDDMHRGAELVTVSPYDVEVPTTLRQRLAYARALSQAGVLPRDYTGKPANVLVAGEMGRELGLSTVQSVLMLNVVEGRPTLGASGVRAVVLRAGHRLRVTDRTYSSHGIPTSVTVTGWRTGDPGAVLLDDDSTETDSRTYTLAMAKQAGLVHQVRIGEDGQPSEVIARSQRGNPLPWELHTERMLEARATTWLGDTLFADVTMGLSVDRDPEAPAIITTAEQVTTPEPSKRAADVLQQVAPTRRTDLPDDYDPAEDALLFSNGDEWYQHAGAQVSRRNKQQLAADRIAKWVAEHADQDVVPMPPPAGEPEVDEPADATVVCGYPECVLDEYHESDHVDANGDVLVPEPDPVPDAPDDPEPAWTEPADDTPVVEDVPEDVPGDDGPMVDPVPDDAPDLSEPADMAPTSADLLAEIDAAAAELDRSRQSLMVRWISTHRKNPEDASADELLPFVEQLRATMAARRG